MQCKPGLATPDTAPGEQTKLAANETIPRDQAGVILTAPQLADRLQVCIGTLRNWRESGKLPYIATPGRSVRYHWPTVFETLLRSQRGGAR